MRFFKYMITETGLWHLYTDGSTTCRCGVLVGENHHKIKIERRDLCWECHKDVFDSDEDICKAGVTG
jgi:hypothetical protein